LALLTIIRATVS